MTENFVLRDAAGPTDADAIATAHAESWRATYRGLLSDAYLDGPIEEERRRLWRARFAENPPPPTVAAWAGENLAGFACAFIREDRQWGSRIDNLHVLPAFKRRGLARRLMRSIATRLVKAAPETPVYLWVYDVNAPARATYEALGGKLSERAPRIGADGTAAPALRYTWQAPDAIGAENDH